jgi:MFS family permease
VVAVALVSIAAGFGQFGAVATLGSVSRSLGHVVHAHGGTALSLAEQAGLSGSALGIGLATIRLASLLGLPIAGLADRFGRRPVLLATAAIGLLFTAAAALSPTYWSFVAIFSCGRPFLSATSAVAQVNVAEQTSSADRSKAVALVAAGYGLGAGLTAIIHSLGQSSIGFRPIFASALVPLVLLLPISRLVTEPDRFRRMHDPTLEPPPPGNGAGSHADDHPVGLRERLVLVTLVFACVGIISGPATSFVFLYAQNIEHQAGWTTALMVGLAGATGLAGLLVGRFLADHVGRRITTALGIVGLAIFGTVTYAGPRALLIGGYVLGVLAGSLLAPPLGALVNELFPTAVRARVSGVLVAASVLGAVLGLVVFGALAQAGNGFGLAAAVTFLPMIASVLLLRPLPETRGREPESIAGADMSPGW